MFSIYQQPIDDRIHVLTHVSGSRQRIAVADGKGNVQRFGDRLRQQRFACKKIISLLPIVEHFCETSMIMSIFFTPSKKTDI